MKAISVKTTLAELGAIVCESLQKKNFDCFLSGGAVVSIYTHNKYESYDLDFVTLGDRKKIRNIMETLGFRSEKSRLFEHPKTKILVEFPGAALQIGGELIKTFNHVKTSCGVLKLLTPTDCVKDRLAAFYHWNDRQGLDQAIWVACVQSVNLVNIRNWSRNEGHVEKYKIFLKLFRDAKERAK